MVSRSPIQPLIGRRYGEARKVAPLITSYSMARGESSVRRRLSSFTTSSSRLNSSSGQRLLAKRSASSFITSSSRLLGICW
jgi:hypothetical protein